MICTRSVVTNTRSLGGLSTFRRAKLLSVGLKKVRELLGVLMGDIVEGKRGDVVGLAGLYELVVFEEILLLGIVGIGLLLENTLCFRSVMVGVSLTNTSPSQPDSLRRDVFELHWDVQRLTRSSRKLISSC